MAARGAGEDDDRSIDDGNDSNPWRNASARDVARIVDRALAQDHKVKSSGRVFKTTKEVSLRSALLDVLPGDEDAELEADEDTELEPSEWLDDAGIEQTFSRFTGKPPQPVVYCCVSSSMASGCWGVFEFRLGNRGYLYYRPDWGVGDDESLPILGAWEPEKNAAARRACILSVYSREWRDRVLPPAMGEWATGEPELLQEAILRVLVAAPDAWDGVLERLSAALHLGDETEAIVDEVAQQTGASRESVSYVLGLVGAGGGELGKRLARGLSSDGERRILVALFVSWISKDPFESK